MPDSTFPPLRKNLRDLSIDLRSDRLNAMERMPLLPPQSNSARVYNAAIPLPEITDKQRRAAKWGLFKSGLNNQLSNLSEGANTVLPYASNLINSFRKPTSPRFAGGVTGPGYRSVRLSRQPIMDAMRNAQVGYSNTLDENTAGVMHQAAYTQALKGLGQIGETEAMANAQMGLQTDGLRQRAEMFSKGMEQEYYDNVTNQNLVNQTQRSANLANAADKLITQRNINTARQDDLFKFGVISKNDPFAVQKRYVEMLKKFPEMSNIPGLAEYMNSNQ